MNSKLVITGSILICLAIGIGAFGAHGIRDHVSAELLHSWETGTTYQFYAGLGLLVVGLSANKFNFSLRPFYQLNLLGVILFSVGIYVYCFHEQVPALKKVVHFVPIGGLAYLTAWLMLIISIIRKKPAQSSDS